MVVKDPFAKKTSRHDVRELRKTLISYNNTANFEGTLDPKEKYKFEPEREGMRKGFAVKRNPFDIRMSGWR